MAQIQVLPFPVNLKRRGWWDEPQALSSTYFCWLDGSGLWALRAAAMGEGSLHTVLRPWEEGVPRLLHSSPQQDSRAVLTGPARINFWSSQAGDHYFKPKEKGQKENLRGKILKQWTFSWVLGPISKTEPPTHTHQPTTASPPLEFLELF